MLVKKCLCVILFCLAQGVISGCWTWRDPKAGEGFGNQAQYVEEGEPTIKPGLTLKISVTASGSEAVQESMKEVDANGVVLMPLIGAVKCDGLSVVALQEKIKAGYKDYFLDPQVTVSFVYLEKSDMKSPWGSVLVMGEVVRPGPVNMPSTRDLNVTRVMMMAGGATPLADKRNVRVTRRQKDGSLKTFIVDIDLIGKEGRADMDVALKPGDVVWVPESWY
jgi:protein involved in polysaccharide export with SLBB domain